jgi:hypothetical protein
VDVLLSGLGPGECSRERGAASKRRFEAENINLCFKKVSALNPQNICGMSLGLPSLGSLAEEAVTQELEIRMAASMPRLLSNRPLVLFHIICEIGPVLC